MGFEEELLKILKPSILNDWGPTILGAILSAIIAYLIAKYEINSDKKKTNRSRIIQFKNKFILLEREINSNYDIFLRTNIVDSIIALKKNMI